MKKGVLAAVLIVGAGALSGCSLFGSSGQEAKAPVSDSSKNTEEQGVSAVATQENSDSVGAKAKQSLQDILSSGSAVKCSVEGKTGKYTVVANGGKVRIDGIDYANNPNEKGTDAKGTMISTGDMAYMWKGVQGIKFNIKEMTDLSKKNGDSAAPVTGNETAPTDWARWADTMETSGAKYDCSPTVVTDADFTPPADVTFQDWGEMMKRFSAMGAKLRGQAPASMPVGESQIPSGAFPQ